MLIEQVRKDQLQARKDRNDVEAKLLTTLLGEVKQVADAAAEKEPRGADGAVIKRDPTDAEVVATVSKFLKNNRELREELAKDDAKNPESAKNYLADVEAMVEKEILERYQPKQLTADEIEFILTGALHRVNLQKNKGALMGFLKQNHAGTYDGKIASQVVDKILTLS